VTGGGFEGLWMVRLGIIADDWAAYDALLVVSQAVLFVAGLGGAVLCGWGGWRTGRRGLPAGRTVALFALFWAGLLAVAGAFGLYGPAWAAGKDAGTAALVAVLAVAAAAVPAGFAIGMVCATLSAPRGD
jgi:hypothetical protein